MSPASAPFGIPMGSRLTDLTILEDLGGHKYIVASPRPHPAFETYLVQNTPNLGTCWIKGLSRPHTNDAFGTQARSAVEEVVSRLERKYGLPERTDMLLHGSIWNEPRDWAMGVVHGERIHSAVWERPRVALPTDLQSVFLGVSSVDYDTILVLEYESTRHSEAAAEVSQEFSDLL